MKEPLKINLGWVWNINEAAEKAIERARFLGRVVAFDFNDQQVIAAPTDTAEAVAQRFMAECDRRHKEYINSDAYKESCRLAKIREEEQRAELAAALKDSPATISLADAEAWAVTVEKNKDPYGGACVKFAETWARLMEGAMSRGVRIADCAEKMSSLADVEAGGITGFMYGCAVVILAMCWKHGEALRLWHNRTSQLGTEGDKANETGGVLNPALLSFK